MFTFSIFRRQDDRPTTRRTEFRRRPLVEDLEGRNLLSTLTGTSVSAIQGNHIGMSVSAIQGNHIGASMIQGGHIGANVA